MALEKLSFKPVALDQQQVLYWGRSCAICGTQPHMQVHFLLGNNCKLTTEERADVIEFVEAQVGPVRETWQNKEVFDVLKHRRHSSSG